MFHDWFNLFFENDCSTKFNGLELLNSVSFFVEILSLLKFECYCSNKRLVIQKKSSRTNLGPDFYRTLVFSQNRLLCLCLCVFLCECSICSNGTFQLQSGLDTSKSWCYTIESLISSTHCSRRITTYDSNHSTIFSIWSLVFSTRLFFILMFFFLLFYQISQ